MGKLHKQMLKDFQIRRFSTSTQRQYIRAVRDLARYYGKSPELINCRQIQDWLLYLMNQRKLNWSTVNTICSGLKFFYSATLGLEGDGCSTPTST